MNPLASAARTVALASEGFEGWQRICDDRFRRSFGRRRRRQGTGSEL